MKSILLNLISSFIWFSVGYFINWLLRKCMTNRKAKVFGRFQADKTLAIGISTRKGPKATSTLRTSTAELNALTKIFPIFQQMKLEYRIVYEEPETIVRNYHNILSIGGVKANQLSAYLIEKYKDVIPVKINTAPPSFEIGNHKYQTQYSEDKSRLLTDYALVVLICPEGDVKKTHMVVCGCRGLGTQGAVQSLLTRTMNERHKRNDSSFVAVIKIDCQSENLSSTVEAFYIL